MAGPGATLQGWAIPLLSGGSSSAPYGEHTYVTSDCGLVWDCWGRNNGGVALSGALGDSAIADCLSQPNSEAGIRYAGTGVCHQTANRILRPANITVRGCQGYILSVFTFGVYGLGPWPQLSTCFPPGTVLAPVAFAAPLPVSARNGLVTIAVYYSTASRAVATQEEADVAELIDLVNAALSHPIEQPALDRVLAAQSELRRKIAQLVGALDKGEIGQDRYLTLLNRAQREAMSQCREALGGERFKTVFGKAGKHPERLIDRDTFVAHDNQRRRA